MIIYGAGMAGLLAANMLRRRGVELHEAQEALPNNHAALLRFRSDVVSKATGIPFRKVSVRKQVVGIGNFLSAEADLRDSNRYALKVSGRVMDRSVINTAPGDRYIAPDTFIAQMADRLPIQYGSALTKAVLEQRNEASEPAISTIPMPVMMALAEWPDVPEFQYRATHTVTAKVKNCDVYQTLYYPGSEPYYRASITGDTLIIEYAQEPQVVEEDILEVMENFGVSVLPGWSRSVQKFGKILPLLPEQAHSARDFILYLTDRYRIYSLGRFATWRQILLDDCVKDVQVIERIMDSRSKYQLALAR